MLRPRVGQGLSRPQADSAGLASGTCTAVTPDGSGSPAGTAVGAPGQGRVFHVGLPPHPLGHLFPGMKTSRGVWGKCLALAVGADRLASEAKPEPGLVAWNRSHQTFPSREDQRGPAARGGQGGWAGPELREAGPRAWSAVEGRVFTPHPRPHGSRVSPGNIRAEAPCDTPRRPCRRCH